MSSPPNVVYEFGPFRLDPAESRLSREGVLVPLTPKAFETLVALVSRAGRLVDKAELRREVWPDTVVEESSLSQHVYLVRRALGEERGEGRYIETVPKRGYRFSAEVASVPRAPAAAEHVPAVEVRLLAPVRSDDEGRRPAAPFIPPRAARPWRSGLTAASAVAAGLAIGWFHAPRPRTPAPEGGSRPVPAAVSNAAESAQTPSAAAAASSLTDATMPHQRDAYDAYVRGLYFWNQRTETGVLAAIRHFRIAVSKERRFAPGHAALADAYAVAGTLRYGPWSSDQAYRLASAAARQALALDPHLAAAHTAQALILQGDGRRSEAEREIRIALDINPRSVTALQRYAQLHLGEGRLNDAIEVTERALALDPVSPAVNTNFCYLLYLARDYERADAFCQQAMDLEPDLAQPLVTRALIEAQEHRFARALSWLDQAETRAQGTARLEVLAAQGYVHGLSGRRDRARQALAELRRLTAGQDPRRIARLGIHAVLGETERALDLLRSCAQDPAAAALGAVAFDPRYDELRRDPRVAEVISGEPETPTWTGGGAGDHRTTSTVD